MSEFPYTTVVLNPGFPQSKRNRSKYLRTIYPAGFSPTKKLALRVDAYAPQQAPFKSFMDWAKGTEDEHDLQQPLDEDPYRHVSGPFLGDILKNRSSQKSPPTFQGDPNNNVCQMTVREVKIHNKFPTKQVRIQTEASTNK
jgi:hypothetical protein